MEATPANGAKPVERTAKVSRLSEETGVDIKYGEKTWRPVQSVIDLVQNHLDANTSIYEKGLLGTIGIKDYNPDDKTQQDLVAQLDKLKYTPDADDQAYGALLYRTLEGNIPDKSLLKAQLDEVAFKLPRVRIKVTNGEKYQLVSYDGVKDLPREWQVIGIRIDDVGSGFDYRLLGMIGASTKKESSGKRGGLGEGLKMSITHLVRAGATVRVYSRNQEQQWIARPKDRQGTVVFEGRKKEGMDNDVTGSLTDVDFSSSAFNPQNKVEIIDALDPRNGEGLGKYILDFRGEQFIPVVGSSRELASLGVAGGRVYVKGLLVEENGRLLFSYNLAEKWAISGRDRKTVQKEVLMAGIRSSLEALNNSNQISQLVEAVGQKRDFLELSIMDENLDLSATQLEQWKEAITRIYNFTPGKSLFLAENTSSNQRRWAKEHGYSVATIPAENFRVMGLFQKIFGPEQKIFLQPETGDYTLDENFLAAFRNINLRFTDERTEDIRVNPQLEEKLNSIKADFSILLTRNLITQLERGVQMGGALGLDRLLAVKFAQAKPHQHFEDRSPFDYDRMRNTIYVKEDALKDGFANTVDLYVQLLKVTAGRDVHDVISQAVATQLAARAVASFRPDVWANLKIESNGNTKFERPITYPAEKQQYDTQWVNYFTLLQRLNTPNITEEDFNQTLQLAKEAKPSALPDQDLSINLERVNKGQINNIFYFNGKLYALNLSTLQFSEIATSGSPPPFDLGKFESLFLEKWKPADEKFMNDLLQQKLMSLDVPRTPTPTPRPTPTPSLYPSIEHFFKLGKSPPKHLLNPQEAKYSLDAKADYYLPFALNSGQSMAVTLKEADKEIQLILKRRGDRIFAKKITDGVVQVVSLGQFTDKLGLGETNLRVFNNVIQIRPNNQMQVTVDRSEFTLVSQYPEQNKGKQFISSNITLDYGGEVWRDPRRILLDSIQNHIDAQKGQQPDITFSVVGPDNKVVSVSKNQLQEMGAEWQVIGVDIKDNGSGYTTPYLTLLGRSSKTDEDLGKFGEGLKLLAASALRQGINVEFASRDWIAQPTTQPQTVKDYETGRQRSFNLLGYNIKWLDQTAEGSETRFSLVPLQPGQQTLTSEQIASVQQSLDVNSQSGQVWTQWIDVLDPRKSDNLGQTGLDRYVLPKDEERPTNGVVSVLAVQPGQVYEKGLLVSANPAKPMIFGYNLEETIIDTRERNAYNQKILDGYVNEYFRNLTDKGVMKAIFQRAREDPQTDYYEYQFMRDSREEASEITKVLWRQAYYEVFGDDAVLSVRPVLNRLMRIQAETAYRSRSLFDERGFRGTTDADSLGANIYRQGLQQAVVNEAHLERQNLQVLPEALTDFMIRQVYTSQDFLKAMQTSEVELPPQDQQKVFTFIQNANLILLTMLESMDSSAERRQALHAVVPEDVLKSKKAALQRITSQNIRIKNPSFPAQGMVESDQNGDAIVYLNQEILSNPNQLLDTYVHEASHFLSGQKDYVINFQRFMTMLALNKARGEVLAA